jgi:hypothetical protein
MQLIILRVLLVFFLSIFFNISFLSAQDNNSLKLNIDFTFAQPKPSELKSVLVADSRLLSLFGVESKVQRNFDYDLCWGGSLLYQVSDYFSVGIGGSYIFSDAYLLYGDVNGNYDAVGKIKVYSFDAVMQFQYPMYFDLNLFCNLSGGYRTIESEFTEDIQFNINSISILPTVITNLGNTFGFNGFAGISYSLNNFEPYIQLGYRYLTLSEVQTKEQTGTNIKEYENIDFKHDLSSLVFKIGLAYNIIL